MRNDSSYHLLAVLYHPIHPLIRHNPTVFLWAQLKRQVASVEHGCRPHGWAAGEYYGETKLGTDWTGAPNEVNGKVDPLSTKLALTMLSFIPTSSKSRKAREARSWIRFMMIYAVHRGHRITETGLYRLRIFVVTVPPWNLGNCCIGLPAVETTGMNGMMKCF